MKRVILIATLGMTFCKATAADGTGGQKFDSDEYSRNADVVGAAPINSDAMLGTYVGSFSQSKITVCLEKVVGTSISGYSIVQGNERAFAGSFAIQPDGTVKLTLKEPGDSDTDGTFALSLYGGIGVEHPTLIGAWSSYKEPKHPISLSLELRKFTYNPKTGKYPESSTRLLKAADVENLKQDELRLMRNEIYARHGYSFKLKDMQEHFDHEAWYMPVSTNVTTQLTTTEEKNENLIRSYEHYSQTHYDIFSR
jgi:hypothetical protein